MVVCESTGWPVQPQYCSSPKDLTMMGSCMVPDYIMLADETDMYSSRLFAEYMRSNTHPWTTRALDATHVYTLHTSGQDKDSDEVKGFRPHVRRLDTCGRTEVPLVSSGSASYPLYTINPGRAAAKDSQKRHNQQESLTLPRSIQRLHIKNVNPLHLPQNLKPLQPRRLLEIRRDRPGLRSGSQEIDFAFDLYRPNQLYGSEIWPQRTNWARDKTPSGEGIPYLRIY